jgi:hypothetical protein
LSPIPEAANAGADGEDSDEEDSPEALLRDEVQLLLESYTLRLNNVLNDILLLQKKVKNRQSLTDISMQVGLGDVYWGVLFSCCALTTTPIVLFCSVLFWYLILLGTHCAVFTVLSVLYTVDSAQPAAVAEP